jgi:hypothetical protein
MRLFDSHSLQRLIGSLRHKRRDTRDLQRKKISICPQGRAHTDPVVWTVRRLYALRVPTVLNHLRVFETGRRLPSARVMPAAAYEETDAQAQ